VNEQERLQWWQRGVLYQIYPRSFMDTNGDGVGDLAGILSQLDYLNDGTPASLGVDAIWLSPFQPSPMVDFGYDIADYCNVDPLFGTLADFDHLVEATHAHGMKVIIDYVPNHTSNQHPWFLASRSSRTDPQRDWYIWRDPQPDGSPPNNWGSFFGGPAWTFDPATGQYYLHQFVRQQPELNWRNPQVRAAMMDVLRFWMLHGVDGFRMDVVGLLIKDELLRDNPLDPHAPAGLRENDQFSRLLQVYNMDQEEIHPVIREIRAVLDEFPDRVGIGELWGPLDRWVRYYGVQGDELQLPFNFRLMEQPWSAQAMRACVDQLEAALPDFAWPNYVLGNHDQPRLASRFGGQGQARLAALMLLTLRGTPTLYNGDEIGLENGRIPPEKIQDPQGINLGAERTRDVCRTPMQWNVSPQAGFSPVEPWLPVSADYRSRNVAVQSADPGSLLTFYKRLLWLRRASPALYGGSYRPLDTAPEVFAYLRERAGERKLVVLNFSTQPITAHLPLAGAGRLALSTHPNRPVQMPLDALPLDALEGLLLDLD
jgi:alpha-glucosidase